MKLIEILFLSWLFIFQQVFATQSLFLDNRGAGVHHYRQYRDHVMALSMTLNNNQSRLNGHPSRREARDLIEIIHSEAFALSTRRHAGPRDLERLNNIRQHLSQLRATVPDFVEAALRNPINSQGVTDFSLENFNQETGDSNLERPAYCSNYPNLDHETLRSFYGQAELGDGFTCYDLNGNGIGLDLSSMGEALISLEADALSDQRRELQNSLTLEAVRGILDESVAYAGIYPGTDNNLSSLRRCASNTAIHNSGNDDLRTLVREHQDSLDTRIAAFNRPFGSGETARRDALMRMQVRQALIIGNLYDLSRPESQPDHQSVNIGDGQQESFPAQIVTNCQEQMQEVHGFAFARHDPSGPSRFMVCREPEVLNRYEHEDACVGALQDFLSNRELFALQRECYYRESRRLEPVTADRLVPIMSASVDSHPLLFNRDDGRRLIPFLAADASYVPSDFSRRVQSLPGAGEISQAVEDLLLTNPEDPHMAIEELLSQPEILPQLSRLIDSAVENQEMHESLKNEITRYQNELGQSATNVCVSDGEHLHQFNFLVEDAIARELENVTDPQERQRLVARRQAAECWMLEDDPPEYEGGLPTGFMALGVGAIALGMVPGVGWAASAALMAAGTGVAGTNAYLQFDHARDRLNATTAAFQGGWTDSQHVLEQVNAANDAESALWLEGLAVGILDVASPAARALYRAANTNGEIAARINAFARGEAGSVRVPFSRGGSTVREANAPIIPDVPSDFNWQSANYRGVHEYRFSNLPDRQAYFGAQRFDQEIRELDNGYLDFEAQVRSTGNGPARLQTVRVDRQLYEHYEEHDFPFPDEAIEQLLATLNGGNREELLATLRLSEENLTNPQLIQQRINDFIGELGFRKTVTATFPSDIPPVRVLDELRQGNISLVQDAGQDAGATRLNYSFEFADRRFVTTLCNNPSGCPRPGGSGPEDLVPEGSILRLHPSCGRGTFQIRGRGDFVRAIQRRLNNSSEEIPFDVFGDENDMLIRSGPANAEGFAGGLLRPTTVCSN
ncbi:MAG: hypothetical protein K9K67_08445 [Bacteriovoracaceae bacterium]|nr:hypothetical protein [Bacteriovoracaceae bacterium]